MRRYIRDIGDDKELKSTREEMMAGYRLSRHSIDIIFKREAMRIVAALPYHLGIDLPPVVAQLPTEIPQVDVHMEEMDVVFQLADDSILHLEFQTTSRNGDLIRFLLYDAQLYARYKQRISTVIIYGAGINAATTEIQAGALTYQVRAIFLGQQNGEERLIALREQLARNGSLPAEAQVDLIFVPLMRHARPTVEIMHDAVDVARGLPAHEQQSILAALLGLGARFLEQSDFERLVEDLMSTITGQQLLEQSFEEGREEGRVGAMREDALDVLSARFGGVPDDVRQRIGHLEKYQDLKRAVVIIATAATLDDVRAQLP